MAGRNTHTRVFRTPLGWTGVAVNGKGVVRIVLPGKSRSAAERELKRTAEPDPSASGPALLKGTVALVRRALSGRPVDLDLPVDLDGYTPFQRSVWKASSSIPYGETRSYAWIAKRIGRPKAARAVGQALGANPVPVLIP